MLLAVGVLAGLVEVRGGGRGQVVDAAMVDGVAMLMGAIIGAHQSGFWSDERGTNLLDSGAPFYDCYRCADGGYVAIGAIEPQFFAALLDGLGLDPEVLPDQHDRTRWDELRRAIADAVATRGRDEWDDVFRDTDACVAPVRSMGELATDPHLRARGTITSVNGAKQPAPAPRSLGHTGPAGQARRRSDDGAIRCSIGGARALTVSPRGSHSLHGVRSPISSTRCTSSLSATTMQSGRWTIEPRGVATSSVPVATAAASLVTVTAVEPRSTRDSRRAMASRSAADWVRCSLTNSVIQWAK